jgi:hypothetical protein
MGFRTKFAAAGAVALAGGALVISQVGTGMAQTTPGPDVRGNFSLIMMAHTSESTPNFATPATNPWNGHRRPGIRFTYRSIACTGAAPVNNISSDLPSYNARVMGSRTPSSLRAHPFGFRVRRARSGGWEMRGQMVLTVCKLTAGPTPEPDPVPDADKPRIYVDFSARFVRKSTENLNWQGRFKLVGGTGRYKDLRGSGRIAGYFFCFNPRGCVNTGKQFRDVQMVMQGDYRDPTPQLGG